MWRFRVARVFFTFVQRLLCRLRVSGHEHIPAAGPYILAVNHLSTADIGIVFVGFPVQPWRYFAGEKWAKHPIWGPLMSWLGVIFINRGTVDRRALREALTALEDGHVFALAPEGTRSKVGAMQPAKDGAAFLASQAGVPILPVGISNTDVLFAHTRHLRRATITMRIGRPFTLPDVGHRPRGHDLTDYTTLIMTHIAALVEPGHRGAYGDTLALNALLAGQDPWPYCRSAIDTTSVDQIK
ncbi:putative acyltransferase [Candidatus Promineifilum breve]|uniref:Acyltransferase n=1 Tax=Candidatus Promineifilum breve TaxID=1806508 RepID=A0A161KB08_9CHLR|nr:lysophospholipid acyltransferase family protein [Candidatus Promineifilum breve]CUS04833.2 putative acyltransferase [Candidatus Promineifilum breve]